MSFQLHLWAPCPTCPPWRRRWLDSNVSLGEYPVSCLVPGSDVQFRDKNFDKDQTSLRREALFWISSERLKENLKKQEGVVEGGVISHWYALYFRGVTLLLIPEHAATFYFEKTRGFPSSHTNTSCLLSPFDLKGLNLAVAARKIRHSTSKCLPVSEKAWWPLRLTFG